MNQQLKKAFHEATGKIIDITSAVNGKKCGCTCLACGEILIARQGEVNDWHFAHSGDRACQFALETVLHQLAKEIVYESNYIRLPDNNVFNYSESRIEKKVKNFQPDATVINVDHTLYIEFTVTHFIGYVKQKFYCDNKLQVLEIDLSQVKRDITKSELKQVIIEEISGKTLIGEPKPEAMPVTPAVTPYTQTQNDHNWMRNIRKVVATLFALLFITWIIKKLFYSKRISLLTPLNLLLPYN
ncbi:MAG: competence protein CoiA family protein [Chitinophagaceae bacterium]